MAGGVSGFLMEAGPSRGRKNKEETPTEGFGIFSMVSRPSSRQVREPIERCCSCTRHLTCSTTGPSAQAYKCCNAGRPCTGCYFWGRCKNRGQLMPSLATARGLLGVFPARRRSSRHRPVCNNPARSIADIFVLTSNRGRGTWGGASSSRSQRGSGGESVRKGGRNENRKGRMGGDSGRGNRMTDVRRKTMSE